MYGIEQSTIMPYNLCGNATCERLNHTLIDLLRLLPKEQKSNWPLHLPMLVFAYNSMLHSTTSCQPYELMFGHKAPTIYDAWQLLVCMGLTNSMNSFLLWIGIQWNKLDIVWKRSVSWAGGKALDIPLGNLVWLWYHPEGCNKIQDKYGSELFATESKHKDPNMYTIKLLNGMVLYMWPIDDSYLTFISHREILVHLIKPWCHFTYHTDQENSQKRNSLKYHPYGTRSKTRSHLRVLDSSSEDEENFGFGALISSFKNRWLWWVKCYQHFHSYCAQINHFYCYSDPNLYNYCRVVHGHGVLRLCIWGLMLWGNCWLV